MKEICHVLSFWSSLATMAVAALSATAQDYGAGEKSPSIEWRTSFEQATDEATHDGKPLLVRVTANWCGPCRQMKQLTFTDSRVIELVRSNFVPVVIDADQHPELVAKFRVEAYPTTLIFAPDQTILKRFTGFQSAADLVTIVTPLAKSQLALRESNSAEEGISALEPANEIPFAFKGYCLVSILEENKLRRGSVEFTAEHRGQTICFQSDDLRKRFQADPEKYWPVANGQCLVSSREGGSSGQGDPRMAVTWRGRIWLFSNKQRQQRFIQSPHYYVNNF